MKNENGSFLYILNESVQNVTEEEIEGASKELGEPEDGEVEVAQMSEEAKKIYAILDKLSNEVKNLCDEHEELHRTAVFHDDEKCKEFSEKVSDKQELIKIYSSIMWRSIRASIDDCPNSLTIRKGWKIFSVPEKFGGMEIIGMGGPFDLASIFNR